MGQHRMSLVKMDNPLEGPTMTEETPKRKGRPPKTKNPVGRPKGEGTVMKEYRQRMLNSPKSRKVLDSIFEVATDTEHKHWPAAMKLIADRILPVAGFEKEAGGEKGRNAIQINISGVPGVNIGPAEGDIIDGEVVE